MPTELLIIKSGNDYIRIQGETSIRCGLDKASVFPVTRLETVRETVERLQGQYPLPLVIKKLILTEEDFK